MSWHWHELWHCFLSSVLSEKLARKKEKLHKCQELQKYNWKKYCLWPCSLYQLLLLTKNTSNAFQVRLLLPKISSTNFLFVKSHCNYNKHSQTIVSTKGFVFFSSLNLLTVFSYCFKQEFSFWFPHCSIFSSKAIFTCQYCWATANPGLHTSQVLLKWLLRKSSLPSTGQGKAQTPKCWSLLLARWDTINLNSPGAGAEPREGQTDPVHPQPQHLPQVRSPQHLPPPAPSVPSPSPVCEHTKCHCSVPPWWHLGTLATPGLCPSPQDRVPCFNRHFKHVQGGFSHTQKLVNQPEPFPLCLSSHGYALQRALFTCQATKQRGKTAAFMILQWGFSQHEAAS